MSVRIPVYGASGVAAYALVDEEDAETVGRYRWNRLPNGYVYSRPTHRGPCIYMHRLLLGLELGDPRQGDHINRDQLDHQRGNLRICTNAQNGQNKPSYRGSSSSYRGVSRARSKWAAVVVLNGVHHRLGRYENEIDAARVAARFRAQHMTHTVEDPALLEQAA